MDLKKILLLVGVILTAGFMACGDEAPAEDAEVVEETVETTETVEIDEPEVIDPEVEMTEEEKLAYVMENCICPDCPSWIPEAAEKGEGGYCATGISECIVDEVGCVCPGCPVTLEMGLEWGYYCTRGSVEEMMAAQEQTE